MQKDIYFPSCGTGKIHAAIWEPDNKIKGIVQFVHGISEHISRYDDFARYLNSNGYLVAGEDHMGHGLSATEDTIGVFTGGWDAVARDTAALYTQLRCAYPDVPFVLYGHSMGSFIARTLLTDERIQLDACVLSGTAWMPKAVIAAGKTICSMHCKRKGDAAKSISLQNLMFSGYNKRIKNCKTQYDWLTSVDSEVEKYVSDPMCGFLVSAGLLRDMLTGLAYIQKKDTLRKMDKDLPICFIAGSEDPVGDYGRGVQKAADRFRKAGLSNVTCKLYPGKRHELHNEDIKGEVYRDVVAYLVLEIEMGQAEMGTGIVRFLGG